jgi:hypothetical protein
VEEQIASLLLFVPEFLCKLSRRDAEFSRGTSLFHVRFKVLAAVTMKCRFLGCNDMWLQLKPGVSEELMVSIIRVGRISELVTLAVSSN